MMSVSISVVMPVYNSTEYVSEAVTAILSQTRPPDEVLVVDDGSTDDTVQRLEPFPAEIRLLRQSNWAIRARTTAASPRRAATTSPAATPTTCGSPTSSSASMRP
jgi:glycosyltransferase involved in cell wall biosynthesis